MQLEIVDEVVIESFSDFEEHKKIVDAKIKEINPKYYTETTDVIRTMLSTTILILEEY